MEWLKEMLSAEEFDRWVEYDRIRPLDDQSNFHVPIAGLHALLFNINRDPRKQRELKREQCMAFAPQEEQTIDEMLMGEDW